jgi:GH15 family glucan-1,4-alpha-glucosidase
MQAIYDRLWVRTPVGGIARYEDDYYFQASSDVKHVPGNPWFVTTLWMADWYIAVAKTIRDLEPALDLLSWAARNASEAGLLPEQVHPFTGKPLSVMPLTWSHAAYVTTILHYQAKIAKLTARQAKNRE